MALISVGIGAACTLIFHITVKVNIQNTTGDDAEQVSHLIGDNNEETSSHDSPNNRSLYAEITSNHDVTEEVPVETTNRAQLSQHSLQRLHSTHQIMTIKDWLLEPQLYQVACVYMTARLYVNITQTYMPLYVQETLNLKAYFVALIPIIMYVSGFVLSLIVKPITVRTGRKFMFALACLIGVASCLLMNPGKCLSKNQYILIKTF